MADEITRNRINLFSIDKLTHYVTETSGDAVAVWEPDHNQRP